MAGADTAVSPSPPASGSITVATGPLPSSLSHETSQEDGTPTAAAVATPPTEGAKSSAGTGVNDAAAAATTTAAAAATSTTHEKSAEGRGSNDEMEGVESTAASAAPAPAPVPVAAPTSSEPEKKASAETSSGTKASTTEAGAPVTTTLKQKGVVRGAFIVFEGLDRAGKTTQAKLLQQRCVESGRQVKYMRFPDRTTPIGQMIDAYLRGETETEDHVIHLLFSANRWEAINKIKAELAAGTTIICDRYYHSGIVYSAAKHLPSLSLSWAKAPEVGLPRPDMVLFLDLEESVARSRGGWGGEVYERGEMQRRVRELFWGLSMGDLGKTGGAEGAASNVSGVHGGTVSAGVVNQFRQEEEDIQIVDANLGVEELSDKVWEVVMPRVEAVERGEVGKTVRIVQ
ncbi:thymidylate kinase-domain-containing protein [Microdochium trichocladiopsis]|uniref:Thymidylate kinase n=1 Tax=Microdochium trichocladiopsis TaxID=1682393 RepID=A0A9P9BSB1_9PEZI|nr:thymidylate kinase-domain-containing protein [Microdochium trichocladiopsis]KAH7033568.1 thymidylate kinase-domain-containing protein [Microdochium trichocladiopsis]